jgi:hypothetical protein
MTKKPIALPTANEGSDGVICRKRPFWAEVILALDSWLRRRQGVFEYSHEPDCIFRAQLSRLYSEVLLSDGTFGRPGDRVIDLHFWNEHIPFTPLAGRSLAWGCRFNRAVAESLRELARFLISKPELFDINIIRADINLDSLPRIAARHGFESILDPAKVSPWECVHRFGENILFWLLTLACNSARAEPNKFWRKRQLMYLSRRVLERKHIAATRGHLTLALMSGTRESRSIQSTEART